MKVHVTVVRPDKTRGEVRYIVLGEVREGGVVLLSVEELTPAGLISYPATFIETLNPAALKEARKLILEAYKSYQEEHGMVPGSEDNQEEQP